MKLVHPACLVRSTSMRKTHQLSIQCNFNPDRIVSWCVVVLQPRPYVTVTEIIFCCRSFKSANHKKCEKYLGTDDNRATSVANSTKHTKGSNPGNLHKQADMQSSTNNCLNPSNRYTF